MSLDLFLSVGETSGDCHGYALIKELIQKHPELKISGTLGPKLRSLGIDCFLEMEKLQVMGFIEVIKHYPRLRKLFFGVLEEILKQNPKAILFIDYPGFHIRLAKKLREKGYKGKIIQYVCPQVWAWGKKRIPLIAKVYDELWTILPFENQLFKDYPIKTYYMGNPSARQVEEELKTPLLSQPSLGIDPDKKVLALFPGSRSQEIQKNFDRMLEGAQLFLEKNPDYQAYLSVANETVKPLIISKNSLKLPLIPFIQTPMLMRHADLALAVSGTVTLELALHKIPTVVVYETGRLTYLLAKYLLKIDLPYICLANIIMNDEIFPELIHRDFTPSHTAHELYKLSEPTDFRLKCTKKCKTLKNNLLNPGKALDFLGRLEENMEITQ